jgi:hypothetical protein
MCTRGTAIGSCSNCGAFACGFHGARLVSGKFFCIRCDAKLKAAAVGANGLTYYEWRDREEESERTLGDPAVTGVALEFARVGGAGALAAATSGDTALVATPRIYDLNDWLSQCPDYGPVFATWLRSSARELESAITHHRHAMDRAPGLPRVTAVERDALYAFWDAMPSHVRELLAASLVLIAALREPRAELPPILRAAIDAFEVPVEPLPPVSELPADEPGSVTDWRM